MFSKGFEQGGKPGKSINNDKIEKTSQKGPFSL